MSVVLTGANGGLAVGFLRQFLKSQHAASTTGYYTVRSAAKAEESKTFIKSIAPASHRYEVDVLDMSSLESVRKGAAVINAKVASGSLPPIRALILNAGLQDWTLKFTDDGIERVFAVNYLHQFLLVLLLLQSMDKEHGRIVYISSTQINPDFGPNNNNFPEHLKTFFTNMDELVKRPNLPENPQHASAVRYGASKLCLAIFSYELQRRLDEDPSLSHISIIGFDPGWVSTNIGREAPWVVRAVAMPMFEYLAPIFAWFFGNNFFLRTAAKTGDDIVNVCFDLERFGEYPKAYYIDGNTRDEEKMNPEARDKRKQGDLWAGSVKWAGLKDGDTALEHWQ